MIYILFICSLFGQEMDIDNFSSNNGTTGSIGTVTINNEVYNQLSLRPEIPIGKLGIGLDIYLYFNDDGMYWDSWDFSSGSAAYRTIIDKIYYLKWGKPEDDLYFRAGALESVTLGQGILVNNYSNVMEYPQVRQIGLNVKANFSNLGFELIHSNFKVSSPGVLAIRSSYNIFGISYVTDLDQNAGLQDIDGDDYPDYYDFYPDDETQWDDEQKYLDIYESIHGSSEGFQDWYENSGLQNTYDHTDKNKDDISALAFDITYPLSSKMILYSQFAQLIGKVSYPNIEEAEKLGWGAVPIGLKTKLGPVSVIAEIRINSERFIFNYWDRAYDVNRITLNESGEPQTKEASLYKYGKLSGFYSYANMELMNLFTMGLGYQSMSGEKWDESLAKYTEDESNQTFLSTITINPSIIPKVGKAEAFYQQSNVSNPFKFTPDSNTIWGYDLGVEVSPSVMLVYQARTTYISDSENLGEFIPQKSVQIETQFTF